MLDLILVSEEAMVRNLHVGEHFSTSDHNIITWDLLCTQVSTSSDNIRYAYHRANFIQTSKYFTDIKWESEFHEPTMEVNAM